MTDKERIAHLEAEVADLKAELRAKLDMDSEVEAAMHETIQDQTRIHEWIREDEMGFIVAKFFNGRLAYSEAEARAWLSTDRHFVRVRHKGNVCYVVRKPETVPTHEETEGDTNPDRFPFR